MNKEDCFQFMFYGIIFLSFGLGVVLGNMIDLGNGYIFIGLGFILLVIAVTFKPRRKKK